MTKFKAYILIDRSGSMADIWSEAISSINAYVNDLEVKDGEIMVATFDDRSYDVIRNSTIKKWKNISSEEISPRGMTPLLDSSARIMHHALDSKTDKAIIIVMTDGFENNSKHFDKKYVNVLTEEIKSKDYQMIFLGANFDKISDVAKTVGNFSADKFSTISKGNFDTALRGLSANTALYASGAMNMVAISDEDKMLYTKKNV